MITVLKDIIASQTQTNIYVRYVYTRFFLKKKSLKEQLKPYVDIGIYFVSVISPLTTLPQIWLIFMHKNIQGLSLFTWLAYLILTFFWLAY